MAIHIIALARLRYGVRAALQRATVLRHECRAVYHQRSDPVGLAGGLSTYGYVNADPLRHIDPFGLANVLIGGNLNAIAVGGFTLGGGVYVSYNLKAGFDAGVYGSVSAGVGVNLGVGGNIGYVPGDYNDISGRTLDISAGAVVGGTFSTSTSDLTPSGSIGVSVGLPTAALTTTHTGSFGYRDAANLYNKLFGRKYENICQ